jgi:hypothetical protein
MGFGKKFKKALNKTGLTKPLKSVSLDFGASGMRARQDANEATEAERQAIEVARQAKAAEETRIFAENEANKAIKAEENRKQTLFGGEIDQQLRAKKELLGETEDPEEKARKEFLRRKLLGI